MYRYRLTSTGHSSHRYGPCEVCKEHASEVFIQTEERMYIPQAAPLEPDSEAMLDILEDPRTYQGGRQGWTQNGCYTLFGHKACLESRQRKPKTEWIGEKAA